MLRCTQHDRFPKNDQSTNRSGRQVSVILNAAKNLVLATYRCFAPRALPNQHDRFSKNDRATNKATCAMHKNRRKYN